MGPRRRTSVSNGSTVLTAGFLTLLASAFCYFAYIGSVLPILPRFVVEELHGGGIDVGLAVGALAASACPLRPIAAHLCTRLGSRRVVMAGMAVAAATLTTYGLASSVAALVALRVVSGVGEAGVYVGLAKLAYDYAPPGREGEAASYFTVALFAGMAVGPPLGERVAQLGGYDGVWLSASGLVLTGLVLALFVPEPQRAAPVSPPEARIRRPARSRTGVLQPDAVGPAAVFMLSMIGYSAFGTFLPIYVASMKGGNPGTVLAEGALVVIAVRLLGARLPDRFGTVPNAVMSLSCQATGWAIVAAWNSPFATFIGVGLVALGISLLYPALFAHAVSRAPEPERAAAVATMTMGYDLATAGGALALGSIVVAAGDNRAAFIVAALTNVAGLALLVRLVRDSRAPHG